MTHLSRTTRIGSKVDCRYHPRCFFSRYRQKQLVMETPKLVPIWTYLIKERKRKKKRKKKVGWRKFTIRFIKSLSRIGHSPHWKAALVHFHSSFSYNIQHTVARIRMHPKLTLGWRQRYEGLGQSLFGISQNALSESLSFLKNKIKYQKSKVQKDLSHLDLN